MRKVTALGELLKGSEKQEKNFLKATKSETRGCPGGGRGCLLAPHSYCECIFMRNAD